MTLSTVTTSATATPIPEGEALEEFRHQGLLAAYTASLPENLALGRLVVRTFPEKIGRMVELGKAVDSNGPEFEFGMRDLTVLAFEMADRLYAAGVVSKAANPNSPYALQAKIFGFAAAAGEAMNG